MAPLFVIRLKEIEGECTLTGFEKCIEVTSYNHGLSMTPSPTGSGPSKASFHDLIITKNLDSTTPKLNYFCAAGTSLKEMQLYLWAKGPDGKLFVYMTYEMIDLRITSVTVKGEGSPPPVETVSFSFGKITWHYSGSKQANQFWDVRINSGG